MNRFQDIFIPPPLGASARPRRNEVKAGKRELMATLAVVSTVGLVLVSGGFVGHKNDHASHTSQEWMGSHNVRGQSLKP